MIVLLLVYIFLCGVACGVRFAALFYQARARTAGRFDV
jgi:hypothetical protein